MVGGLIAANSSTILTHLNWGASYLVHDFYQRFITPEATEKHYVFAGRVATVAALLLLRRDGLPARDGAGQLQPHAPDRRGDRAALPGPLVLVAGQRLVRDRGHDQLVRDRSSSRIPHRLAREHARRALLTILFTTVCWLAAAFLAPQTDRETLIEFYRKVRPFGPGWAPIRDEAGLRGRGRRRAREYAARLARLGVGVRRHLVGPVRRGQRAVRPYPASHRAHRRPVWRARPSSCG